VPTYEYQCTACEERLEAEQRFSDAPLTVCPTCGGKLRRVYSAVGVVFKGSGFYKNDSRSSSTKSSKSSSESSGSESTPKSTGDATTSESSPSTGAAAAPASSAPSASSTSDS
jgi:putative FmdB family regulatory protein